MSPQFLVVSVFGRTHPLYRKGKYGNSFVAENRESNKNIERTGVSNKPVGPETCSNEIGSAVQCKQVQASARQASTQQCKCSARQFRPVQASLKQCKASASQYKTVQASVSHCTVVQRQCKQVGDSSRQCKARQTP